MNWFLSENRVLRFSSFAVYYIAQGLPIGLLSIALPAWLSEQGLSATDIAFYVAISGLPWAFKLVAGPIMDRFSFLPMGRRRPWIVGSQIGLLIAMVVLSLVPDPVNQIVLLTWAAFAVNCFAAVQDVAVDGMAIDVLPNDERGRANSFMAFGQVAGYAGSGALSALALVQFGLLGAGLFLTFGLFLIFIWGVVVRERKGERLFPWSEGEALSRSITLQADDWMSIARDLRLVFFLKASLIMIVVTGCWRIAAGFWLVGAPVIVTQDLGYESTVYSYWTSTFSMVAAVLGLLLGPLIDKTGAKRILFVALIGYGLTFFIAGNLLDLWKVPVFLLSIAAAEALLTQAIFISFIALHMSICWNKVSATQFAIYMAWANLGRSIGAKIYGEIAPNLEQGEALMIMGALGFVGAALVLLLRTRDHAAHLETLTNSRVAGTS
jgi:PAT family beta-lactamase induction signal transducer AmpG